MFFCVNNYLFFYIKVALLNNNAMHSNVTIKNVSWPHFSWPTLYMLMMCMKLCNLCINCRVLMSVI